MRYRSLFVVPLCLACVGLGAMLNRPATGQGQPAPQQPIGRYSQVVIPREAGDSYVFVLDSATGQVWSWDVTSGKWNDFGSPAQQRR